MSNPGSSQPIIVLRHASPQQQLSPYWLAQTGSTMCRPITIVSPPRSLALIGRLESTQRTPDSVIGRSVWVGGFYRYSRVCQDAVKRPLVSVILR
ncbi:Hypothetical predicted protein [Pelobates cultripes]|uniref:Uncharacterized protein n=1 Tax=Pelobates cultripes TaxID=61616 RepID=A0AAD1VSC1_PELCU|nr:Hypothetical predicted protein [Pelobates cultripes]